MGGWVGGAEKTAARKQDRAEQAIGERTQTELGEQCVCRAEGGGSAALIFHFKREKEERRLQDDSMV